MAIVAKSSIKSNFETGDKPTQTDFEELIDESIPNWFEDQKIQVDAGTAGLYEVQSTASATARVVGAVGVEVISAVTTASAIDHIGGTTVGTAVFTAATTAAAQDALGISAASLSRGAIAGLGMSNDPSVSFELDIAEGKCRDSADGEDMTLAAFSKLCTSSWVSGTGNNGLATGATARGADVWYHVFVVTVSSTNDIMFDSSLTCANGVANHSVTAYRRIGSVKINSGNTDLEDFTQVGDLFTWADPPLDHSTTTLSTTAVDVTLSTPLGVATRAIMNMQIRHGSLETVVYISDKNANDEAPTTAASPIGTALSRGVVTSARETVQLIEVMTDTASIVRARSENSSTSLYIATLGWRDSRGIY